MTPNYVLSYAGNW